jgi:excisionase family DNA binding protein
MHDDLTTREASDLLNISESHLALLLDEGNLPFERVGTDRRMKARDVLAYKKQSDEKAEAAVDELAAEAQKLGMY